MKPKNSMTKKLLMGLGAVLVAIGLFSAGYYTRGVYEQQQDKAAAKVGATFVQDLVSGKTSEAYSLTSKSLQSKQSKEDFTNTVKGLKADKPVYDDVQSTTKDGHFYYSQRVLGLPAASNGNTTASFFIVIDKQGMDWRVSQVTVN